MGHSISGLDVSEHTSDPSTGELGIGGPLGHSDWPAEPIIKPQVNERCHPIQHVGRLLRQTPDAPRLSSICTCAHLYMCTHGNQCTDTQICVSEPGPGSLSTSQVWLLVLSSPAEGKETENSSTGEGGLVIRCDHIRKNKEI